MAPAAIITELDPEKNRALLASHRQPEPRRPRTAIVAAALEPTLEDVDGMIATAAYYLAAARNFMPGHELDDWLEAERAVHAGLYG